MDEPSRFLFVYGTLRRGGGHPMAELLGRHVVSVGPATVVGRLFDTGRFPAAVPSKKAGGLIHGELMELDDPEQVWPWLDEYEGYRAGGPADSLFVRREANATPESGATRLAWVYWYNKPVSEFTPIESGRYGE